MIGKIYIAGPMRGIPLFNFPAFDAARDKLRLLGWEVTSPADLDRENGFDTANLPDDTDWNSLEKIPFVLHDAIQRDIKAITQCDAIYMLGGWQNSQGATAEHHLAQWMGKQTIYQTGSPLPDILEEALSVTKGDRQQSYGHPADDFSRTAQMWSAMKGVDFTAKEVASFMIAVKLSREAHRPKRDNWVDIAGYARCGSLCPTGE